MLKLISALALAVAITACSSGSDSRPAQDIRPNPAPVVIPTPGEVTDAIGRFCAEDVEGRKDEFICKCTAEETKDDPICTDPIGPVTG